ncbi:MAG: hypothetical protein CME25_07560 [Gemmatimonadetes bacterium]|nr:hypothetical protein [Gemmatimonadota bacterium]|tara:strand:- start:2447 stop:2860 length:414 start_codon:yes stop_codon:yes gene_type:complete
MQKLCQNPDLILVDPKVEGNMMKAVKLIRRMPKLNHVGLAIVTEDLSDFDRCKGKGFDGIEGLPTLPSVYVQVEQLCEDPDPSITMKLLKLSNPGFFGFNREIKSVKDAVSLLDNQTVKKRRVEHFRIRGQGGWLWG